MGGAGRQLFCRTASSTTAVNPDLFEPGIQSLYDGTVATWQYRNRRNIAADPTAVARPRVNERHGYDQLNRLVNSSFVSRLFTNFTLNQFHANTKTST